MKPIRNSQFAIKSSQTPRGGVSTCLGIQGLFLYETLPRTRHLQALARSGTKYGFKPLLF
jgi:hypothetical protein